jgi:two-component system NtrC family sensor kinase
MPSLLPSAGGAVIALRILLVASLVLPALLFAYGAAVSHRDHFATAQEQLRRTTDILREHATKVLETDELVIDRVNEIVAGMTDDDILANERELHERLRALIRNLPQILDIFVVSADGRALVSAVIYPLPHAVDFSDRDYFQAQQQRGQTYVSALLVGRDNHLPFFNVSKRRPPSGADGAFNGLTGASVQPSYFEEFYARAIPQQADAGYAISLIRAAAGDILVRYPPVAAASDGDAAPQNLLDQIRRAPEQGVHEAPPAADGTARVLAYHRLQDYPVYVLSSVRRGTILRAWRRSMAGHLIFGAPATLCLFGITWFALRRTAREHAAVEAAAAEVRRREAAEETMRQSQRLEALGKLTGGIAHDFNNLLMVIGGSVEMARKAPPEHIPRLLDAALRATRRGEALTRQLLAFGRRQQLSPKVLDLRARIPKVAGILRQSLPATITIEVNVPADLWTVELDPSELELALLNLAVNARDAMPDGGQLRLSARNETMAAEAAAAGEGDVENLSGDFVVLRIADTGGGMPPDVAARAFEPFFTTKEAGKGTGLGLSQVYGFARQSGGTAVLLSSSGRGTAVKLYLPRTAKPLPRDDGEPGALGLVPAAAAPPAAGTS